MESEYTIFDNNYNSNVGKLFRSVNTKVAEYYGEPSEELFGSLITPISNYIAAYYWGDCSAGKTFDIIVKILHNYDMICYDENTKKYKTYLDRSIVVRLNKLKRAIDESKEKN